MIGLTTVITAATVYPGWVRLSRRGSVNLEMGTHTVEVFGLPGNLNPETLRVTIYGSDNPRLLGVKLNSVLDKDRIFKSTDQLEHEVEAVENELNQLADKAGLVKQNRNILDKLVSQTDTYASALASGALTPEKQVDVLSQLRSHTQNLDEEARAIQIAVREKEQQKQQLTDQLEDARSMVPQKTFTAVIDVELLSSTDLTFEISYVVSGVSWKPVYELRLLEMGKNPSLDVGYLADVCQGTGENWEDISLTLSTARPALSSQLPGLDPWFLKLSKSPAFKGQEQSSSDSEMPFTERSSDDHPASESEPLVNPAEGPMQVDTAVSYLINNTVTIPSDDFQHKVEIARFFLVPELDYQATPKLSQAVYRQARIENNSRFTLLPGTANIIIGDEYVGSLYFDLVVPGEKFELFLGNDNRIKVERELKRRDVDKRMLWGKRHIVLGYQIKVESMLHHQAVITINDQIPIPTHEDIKVKLESSDPKPAEQDKLNQLVWNLVLEPKETRTIDFEFSVDSPPGKDLIGL